VVFYDDFESGLGGWSVTNGVWEVGVPTIGPPTAHSGSRVASNMLGGVFANTSSNLVSPSISLPEISSALELHLRFWHWFAYASDQGVVSVQEQLSPGVWSAATQLTSYSGTSGSVWTRPQVDLSAYAGKKVRILFGLANGGSAAANLGWYLDDVSVTVVQADRATPYADDFEGGLGDWWAHNGSWEVGTPTSGPGSCHSGLQCAATVLGGDYVNTNCSLVSPSIRLPAIGESEEIHLRFWHWFSFALASYNSDYGVVSIQTETKPGVWSAAVGLTTYSGAPAGVWTRPSVDLSAYAGKKVRLGFGLTNGQWAGVSSGWYVDDVTVAVEQVP
jgi:bacillopeptidase F